MKYFRPVWRYKTSGSTAWTRWSPSAASRLFPPIPRPSPTSRSAPRSWCARVRWTTPIRWPLRLGRLSDLLVNQVSPPSQEGISHDQARMDGFLHRGNGREQYPGRGPWVRGYVVGFYDPAFRYGGRADYSRGMEIEPGIDCLHGSTTISPFQPRSPNLSLIPWRTRRKSRPRQSSGGWPGATSPACISIPGGPPPRIAATTGILRPTSTPLRRKIQASRDQPHRRRIQPGRQDQSQ